LSEDTEFKNALKQAKYIGQCELLSSLLDFDELTQALSGNENE